VRPIVIIDGDEFVFRATAALEQDIRWDEDNHVLYANEQQSWETFVGMVGRIHLRFEARRDDVVLCFTSSPNFRSQVDPTYKMHRTGSRKPMCYTAIRERADKDYKVRVLPGLEADDVMGIIATSPGKRPKIIVSQDKDMKTIPTTVWDGKDLHVITEEQADYMHMLQTLVGDTADGYKGCPKVGPVKAEKVLKEAEGALWGAVVKTYEKYGLTEADALVQARLARILRYSDWDSEKKEPILWTPSS
jgi:DNA polymerase-1